MPRSRNTRNTRVEDVEEQDEFEIEFVDEVPAIKSGSGIDWMGRLERLVKNPNHIARIGVFDTPERAGSAQSNLSRRKVHMPLKDDEWAFFARGCELFGVYRGKAGKVPHVAQPAPTNNRKKSTDGRVRRTNRTR